MKSLFLFFTQSEIGATDYLSRTGEQGAETLTETIISFLSDSLQIHILKDFEARAQSLKEDVLWRSFKDQNDFQRACKASLSHYPEILLLSGNDIRSLKTCEVLAKGLALPICVDNRIDKHKNSKPYIGTLNEVIVTLIEKMDEKNCPKVFLVATSFDALLEWVKEKNIEDYSDYFEKVLKLSSESNTIPTVFISGLEKDKDHFKWIFDLPKETN